MGQTAQLAQDNSLNARHRYALAEVKEIVGRIWKWVLLGVGVGALFHGYFPQQWAENLAELLILRKVIKWQALALFTGILTLSIISVGWFFNLIL